MTEPRETIDLNQVGVLLPTHGIWVDIPGSIFQVMTKDTDTLGVLHIRIHPDCMDRFTPLRVENDQAAVNHWDPWMKLED